MPENGEWRQHHAGIGCAQFRPLPLTVNTWYPPMSKSASMGNVGSSSIRQGTHQEPHPQVYGARGRQMSGPAVWPTGDCEWVLAPLGPVMGGPVGTLTGDFTYIWENLCGGETFQWNFHTPLKQYTCITHTHTHTHTHIYIYIPLDALGCEEWTSWLCGHHSSPKGAQLRADLGCLWFSHGRKGELVSEHMTSPALQDAAEKARFTLTASRELYGGFHD